MHQTISQTQDLYSQIWRREPQQRATTPLPPGKPHCVWRTTSVWTGLGCVGVKTRPWGCDTAPGLSQCFAATFSTPHSASMRLPRDDGTTDECGWRSFVQVFWKSPMPLQGSATRIGWYFLLSYWVPAVCITLLASGKHILVPNCYLRPELLRFSSDSLERKCGYQ